MEKSLHEKLPFHYGWVIVFTGTLCIVASLGFGRFALGMLLPSMADTLGLSYSEMGFISTGNFVGYLVSVLVAGFFAVRMGTRRLIFIALLIVGLSMSLISRAGGFSQLLILYFITGVGSGASNVPIMGLVSSWFAQGKRGRAAGFIVIGSGIAIVFSGKAIPFINSIYGAESWRVSWLVLGCMTLAIAFVCVFFLRNRPEDMGLAPAGQKTLSSNEYEAHKKKELYSHGKGVIFHLGAIYFLFGYTYVIYATFIVTSLVKERGFSESVAGNFWAWVGLLSLFSGPVFGALSDRLGRKAGLIMVFSLQMISYLLVATGLPGMFLYLSIFFYGIVAWSIPSIMAAAVGDYVGAKRAAAVFGFITFIFGLGQITGPAVAGVLAEAEGGFSGSFYMAAVFAAAAIILTGFLKKPKAVI
jgi:MFS family permease